jgi:hypothetical protein
MPKCSKGRGVYLLGEVIVFLGTMQIFLGTLERFFENGLYTTERPVFSADTEKYGTAFSAGDSPVCANASGAFATQVLLVLVPAQPGFTRSGHHYSQLVDVRAILGSLVL